VHIEIPIDVIISEAGHLALEPRALPGRPGPSPDAIARAAELLRAAKRPLAVLGGGAVDAGEEARRLVERLDAPFVNTVNAKGLLPPGHPLHAGENMAWPPVRAALREADVVVAVGTEFGETEMYPDPQPLVFDGRLIRIDIDPEQLVRGFAADIPILSDARLALAALNDALGAHRLDGGGAQRAKGIRAAVRKLWWPAVAEHERVLEVVRRALSDPIIAGDQTQPVYAGNQFFEPSRPRSWFNSSTDYGTLGYGLPAAIGAKLAAPERPVVALIGDGGLQFTLPELAAAVEAQVPIIVLLWNNQGYGEIKTYMAERAIPQIGVDIFTPDFVAIARAFGCAAERAGSREHLRESLDAASGRAVPTLIEIEEDAAWLTA
jgi:acetolactate synthase I/II/III large subunit